MGLFYGTIHMFSMLTAPKILTRKGKNDCSITGRKDLQKENLWLKYTCVYWQL
jgi:hypothetical protein